MSWLWDLADRNTLCIGTMERVPKLFEVTFPVHECVVYLCTFLSVKAATLLAMQAPRGRGYI